MERKNLWVVAMVAVLMTVAVAAQATVFDPGTLYELSGSTILTTGGSWTGASINWTASNFTNGDPYLWHYTYTLDTGTSGVDSDTHFILEVTDPFPLDHVVDSSVQSGKPADSGWFVTVSSDVNSFDMPGALPRAVTWNFETGGTMYDPITFDISCYHQPDWQNFYAVDGQQGTTTTWNDAYNAGYLGADQAFDWNVTDQNTKLAGIQHDYGRQMQAVAPDGYVVPEPGTMILLGLAFGAGLLGKKYRLGRAKS